MILTEGQKQLIRNNYKAISDLTRLTQMVSEDDNLDGRSKIGRAIRKFMVERGLNYETSGHQKIDDIILEWGTDANAFSQMSEKYFLTDIKPYK